MKTAVVVPVMYYVICDSLRQKIVTFYSVLPNKKLQSFAARNHNQYDHFDRTTRLYV